MAVYVIVVNLNDVCTKELQRHKKWVAHQILSSDRRSADGAAAGIRMTEAGGVEAAHETARRGCSTTGFQDRI